MKGRGLNWNVIGAGLLSTVVTARPPVILARHQAQTLQTRCGAGTIAFRADGIRPPEKRFRCDEASYYDGGQRGYRALFRTAAASHSVTLVLIHQQAAYNGGAKGVLWSHTIKVRPSVTAQKGTVDFSSVYSYPGPAGAPPFGRYYLTIHRGNSDHGVMLATGWFDVTED